MSRLLSRCLQNSSVCLAQRRHILNSLYSTTAPDIADQSTLDASSSKPTLPKKKAKKPRPPLQPLRPGVGESTELSEHLKYKDVHRRLAVEDLESLKPSGMPDTSDSAYEQKYTELKKRIKNSFYSSQLKQFASMYGLELSLRATKKDDVTEVILESWGWKPLRVVREERELWIKDDVKDFPMEPGAAFLFMGKDGDDLTSLAKRYNVNLSFTSNPLSLRVQGLKGAIKQVQGFMKVFEQDVVTDTIELPLGITISREICRDLSIITGVYAEPTENGKISVAYRNSRPESVDLLKRLAVQKAAQAEINLNPSLQIISPQPGDAALKDSHSYSFYPFFPSQTSSSKIASSSPFRLRRVGQWLRRGAQFNMNSEEKDETSLQRSAFDISHWVAEKLGTASEGCERVVSASVGHVLFLSHLGKSTLVPPISGNVTTEEALSLVNAEPGRVAFNPGVPKSVMITPPSQEQMLLRLVYTLIDSSKAPSQDGLQRTLTVEFPKSLPSKENVEPSDDVICQYTTEATVDILLPSRATDIRFSAKDVQTLSVSQLPAELTDFVTCRGADDVKVPLTVEFQGQSYILELSAHIRSSSQKLTPPRSPFWRDQTQKDIECIVETRVDAEDGIDFIQCKLQCQDVKSDEGWKLFLDQCDSLTIIDDKPSAEHPFEAFRPWLLDAQTVRPKKGDAVEHVFEQAASVSEFDSPDDIITKGGLQHSST